MRFCDEVAAPSRGLIEPLRIKRSRLLAFLDFRHFRPGPVFFAGFRSRGPKRFTIHSCAKTPMHGRNMYPINAPRSTTHSGDLGIHPISPRMLIPRRAKEHGPDTMATRTTLGRRSRHCFSASITHTLILQTLLSEPSRDSLAPIPNNLPIKGDRSAFLAGLFRSSLLGLTTG